MKQTKKTALFLVFFILLLCGACGQNKQNESGADKNLQFLNDIIEQANKEFPQEAGFGLTVTKAIIDGDYMVYITECDEDILEMDLLRQNKSNMYDAIKVSLASSEPELKMLRNACINADKGIAYRYEGDTSGDSFIIRIPCSELKEM